MKHFHFYVVFRLRKIKVVPTVMGHGNLKHGRYDIVKSDQPG
ncbi:MAG: hypothetical protein ACLGHN_01555 [Bacteriovoracia bacterium]